MVRLNLKLILPVAKTGIQIYPPPNNGSFYLNTSLSVGENGHIGITDVLERILFQDKINGNVYWT